MERNDRIVDTLFLCARPDEVRVALLSHDVGFVSFARAYSFLGSGSFLSSIVKDKAVKKSEKKEKDKDKDDKKVGALA